MTEKTRLFIALDIPVTAVQKVMEFQKMVKKSGIQARWVAEESIHQTLKFIGETDSKNIPGITEILENTLNDFEPFNLSIANAGVFPDLTRPSILWVGLYGETELLMKLSRSIDRSLFEKLEIKRETKSFKPHITIARIKTKINHIKLGELIEIFSTSDPLPFVAEKVILYQSILTRDGAKYKVLKTFQLNKKRASSS